MLNPALIEAWNEAGRQLGVRVHAPYDYLCADETLLQVDVFLPGFGSVDGMIVICSDARELALRHCDVAFSHLLDPSYLTYDERLFRETLSHWGWFGPPSLRPLWL